MARRPLVWLCFVGLAAIGIIGVVTRGIGFSARATPWASEAQVIRAARRWATPGDVRGLANPVPATTDAVEAGMKHWADFCATCHGNDGRGDTAIGRNVYPPAPDMRERATQDMTDGELFYVIERGIPLTGMPARATGTADGERASWELVHFIRRLPRLTHDEMRTMEALNPISPARSQHKADIDDFLSGGKKIVK